MEPETAARLVGAHHIRGLAPQELDEAAAHRIGSAFVALTGADEIAVARDMRGTSPMLADAFARGVLEHGADVVDAGPGSADYLSFVSGCLGVPGAMVTAGHHPAAYNGITLCRAGAVPVGEGSGLELIRAALAGPAAARPAAVPGRRRRVALLDDYAARLRSLVDLSGPRPVKVVVDAGNGMAGLTVPLVLDHPLLEVVPVYFEPDGAFPNHEADPARPANVADLRARVRAEGADVGLAFDGDGDRCLAVDERGEAVPASSVLALVASRLLADEPGARVVHDLLTSRSAIEVIEERGGVPVRSRVGRPFVKALMAEHGAVLGGEHSGRYYFRDFWCAETGMLAALHLLAELSATGRPLSELVSGCVRYAASAEIELVVPDPVAAMVRVERSLGDAAAATDRLDGLTASFADGSWFNLRASGTAPVLRLNAEAPDEGGLGRLRNAVLRAATRPVR
ncbi:phosphomannomutase/phosphoglucomutase [Kitasatospora paranensis]|uniref:Phosphomannomutase/phosphoglucomutase n=1 Tax=Kitasatospora paranensis TaxID=258053 RepID=A0ABW2G5M5_9ACTN